VVIKESIVMNVVSKLLGACGVVVGLAAVAGAQGTAPPPAVTPAPSTAGPFEHLRLGVTLEGFYQYNWNRPYDRVNLLRAYDTRANVFSLQQTAVVIESVPAVGAGRRFGARVDLQFGQATETVQGSPANEPRPDVYRNVWQAYGTYVFPVGRGLQADFGKFASNLGYETNYAKDNNHFSRAYLFNFLPFYHSGLRLTLPVNDRVTVSYMLTNGIQQTEDFNDYKSHHVTAVVKPASSVAWTSSYYFGQEQADGGAPRGPDGFFRVFDSYATWTATPSLGLGLDVNYVTNEINAADDALSLQGTAVYARYQVTSPAAFAVRYERLDDQGLFGGIDQVLHEVTATAEYKLADGFLVRGEFRRDWSNQRFFTGPVRDDLRMHQNTALVGLVWWFGNKQGAW
jgi:Putative beta-barrel porin-2, OmpL-like. bbp2